MAENKLTMGTLGKFPELKTKTYDYNDGTFTLASDWQNATNTITNWDTWTQPVNTFTTHYCYHGCYCSGKITLSLKEVDVLRRAAKKDDKLKDVLNKLTPKIEVKVEL